MPTYDPKQEEKGNEEKGNLVLIIAGPTACGKSAMAMDVAKHFKGTVINADSQQVYKELRVVTARPSEKDENQVPHRLFGTLSGTQACSAGQWTALAVDEIKTAFSQNRLPLIVGGTGMYLQSLTEGLSPIPDVPDHVRERARTRHLELGAQAFHEEVHHLDPPSAERLPVGDTQRLLRAWEVSIFTGRAMSLWQEDPRIKPLPDVRFATIAVIPPRDKLYADIDRRFTYMVENGALDEIRALAALNLDPDLPMMKALGVGHLLRYIKGEIALDEAISEAQKRSRNYAKRQLTWVRNQVKNAYVLDAQYSQCFRSQIISFVQQFLLTGKG